MDDQPPIAACGGDLPFTARSAGQTGCALLFYYKDVQNKPLSCSFRVKEFYITAIDTVIMSFGRRHRDIG